MRKEALERHDEREMPGSVAINGVLWKRACSPCIISAYSVDAAVNVHFDEVLFSHLVWVTCCFKF